MTASQRPVPPPLQCGECPKTFKSLKAIRDHCLATRHFTDRYCHQCRRVFGSKTSLEQHNNVRHPPRSVAAAPPTPRRSKETSSNSTTTTTTTTTTSGGGGGSRAPPLASLQLSWRGNVYSTLSAIDQAVVYDTLVSACHARARLQRDHYRLYPQGTEDAATPAPLPGVPKRRAVVLDCEMAGAAGGRSELVLVCAIDFLTGEVLVNSLVMPTRRIISWRSKISGVTAKVMAAAQAAGQALAGWPAARAELWRHIDADTVLVGQALKFDLQVLGMVHTRVVDSAILTADAVFGEGEPVKRTWGLHTLCNELLGLRIRADAKVHDCVEDVMAAREVVLRCLSRPAVLRDWADRAREVYWEKARQKESRKLGQGGEPGGKKVATQAASSQPVDDGDDYDEESEVEILRWEDIADIWPKSPSWSD